MARVSEGRSLRAETDALDSARLQRYRFYLDFYRGEQWIGRRRAGETRLVFNYARALVRKAAAYLMATPVGFDVLPDAGRDTPQATLRLAESALREVYDANDQHALDAQTALDAAVLGDGAFKVTWRDDVGRPSIAPVDPAGLWAWWAPDNPRDVRRVVQRYDLEPDDAERLFGARPVGDGHATMVCEEWTAARYRIELDGTTLVDAANPYGWIPYVLFPNTARPHEFWGASDLEDVLDVCRELNARMTTISRILQVSGYPITVLENVAGSDGVRAEPGAIWELPEDSRAYLLDMLGGGVGLHIDYVNLLYRQLHDISETPRTAFGDSGRALSGVALEVEIQPLVQKVMRKRRVWDGVFARRNALVLDLLERFGAAPLPLGGLRRTRAIWGEVLPSDRAVAAQTETRLVAAGIHSRRGAMAALGDQDPARTWHEVLEERADLAPPTALAMRGMNDTGGGS